MGIYQLYNPTRAREYFYFYCSISITMIIFLITWFKYSQTSNPTELVILWFNIWYELYLFVLVFLCFFTITPFIGQRGKYQLSLTAYFFIQTTHITNLYITSQPGPLMTIVENFGPIIYFAILFQILFQRIVEMLHAIYNSSITDGLTGLYNRKFFYTRVTQYIEMKMKPSIIFCDIDNFKKLNDTKGHQMGDEVLRQVAAIIREESEEIGLAGRYGGEELVVVLTNSTYNVEDIAEKIRKRIQLESGSTVSIGYSRMKPGLSAEQLIKQADHAMYISKKSGKNRVTGYAPNLGSLA
jgi:diguanylate cyclase (GGDEF)-like protein